ncbi:unnamed protein product [Clonostachys solani]|uniref:Zn(2)-C6 fungal-type domain-containing protein n=1 Tax=Clonostachys solani TaxID=160281 RepID=A0A9P0ELV1_9HYPO|nr:unnamed protein product [Clonostachys solani]
MASMSPTSGPIGHPDHSPGAESVSPGQPVAPKNVAFELLFFDAPQYRARLPMRVQIYPHDTTDSIVTTVKNFYGLYSGPTGSKGVSFEDKDGNTLIARYENFRNNMIVYVRVFEEFSTEPATYSHHPYQSSTAGSQMYYSGSAYPNQRSSHEITRPSSRTSRRRSRSPSGSRGSRSNSASNSSQKRRSRSSKNRTALSQADSYSDHQNGYSSGEDAPSTTSGRAKELLGTTDISVDNIVEGGRRKRAKFESSELPLFAPPQMPAATSNPSVSPARRIEQHRPSLSFTPNGHNPFTNPRPMHSAQAYANSIQSNIYTPNDHDGRRTRANSSLSGTGAILPTPDPTVGSCMSEEDKDVALQLMRLGDMSNISHGRTSASTLDDTFSGKADATSSTGATSDGDSESEDELPAARRQKLDMSGASRLIYPTTEMHPVPTASTEVDEVEFEGNTEAKSIKNKPVPKLKASALPKPVKSMKVSTAKAKKAPSVPGVPISPASQPPSRKQSVVSSTTLGVQGEDDQPDLSTKPRCQRCRKSKKGCDRQRPCGRCRDAGLSADQCISEDEGNGRKGRYGRHMGVPIKKDEALTITQPTLLPAAPIAPSSVMTADKAKKRKR